METTIHLPAELFERSVAVASARGETLELLIVEAVAKEVEAFRPAGAQGPQRVELPLLRSRHPGTMDLAHFDFDDLLA